MHMQFDAPAEKLEDIASGVQSIVPEGEISDGQFDCGDSADDQSVVLYRATISGQSLDACELLLATLEQWVATGSASLIVLGNRLTVESTCPLEISSFSAPDTCTTVPPPTNKSSPAPVIGAVVGIIILIVVVLLVICFVMRWRRKR